MKKIILTLIIMTSFFVNAQSGYNAESFNVTRNDLETNTYKKDSTANALVIYEEGNSYYDKKDYILKTEIKHKIKILNKEGFNHAKVSIHLYKNKSNIERVENILATTYNESNGKITKTKLLAKDIFNEEYDENHTLVKFTLPNIKVGSVITYSYKLISPFMFKYKGWDFQSDIPKLYSEYKTSIPANWEYNIKLVGGKKLYKNEQDKETNCLEGPYGAYADCSISTYAMKDIPAFIEEDYITSEDNYLARIEYELKTFKDFKGEVKHYTKTWKVVDKEIETDKEIGIQLRKAVNIKELLSTNIVNESDPLKKAKAIYKFVKDNYTWNRKYNIFTQASIKDLLKEKSGNVSSINILLHNLLKKSGIQVHPVLCSTRNNGFPTKIYPVLSDFNYLIVQATINNKTYLLDATDKYLNFGALPFRCLNHYGRLFDFKNGSKWIDIKPLSITSSNYMVSLSFDDNENLIGNIKSKSTGYISLRNRKSYYANKNTYIENLQNENLDIEISNYEVTSSGENSLDFSEKYDITYTSEKIGDNIYLNPFFMISYSSNPFKLQERTYPIDFGYKKSFTYMANIDLGDTYEIIEKPKDLIKSLPNKKGTLAFSTKVIGSKINMILRFDFKSTLYEPEYYPYLKDYISKIIDLQKNSLFLLKKK